MYAMNRQPDPRIATLQHVIDALVRERQRLRTAGGDVLALERNRKQIVERQHELADALIAAYGPRSRAA